MSESGEEPDRCSICLQSSCENCSGSDMRCSCVPLLQFCSRCSNQSDKRVCIACIDQLLLRHRKRQQEEPTDNNERPNDPVLSTERWNVHSNDFSEFAVNVFTIHQTFQACAIHLEQQDRLLAEERIAIKALLYQLVEPEAHFCLVASGEYRRHQSNGLLVQVAVAKFLERHFGWKTEASLVSLVGSTTSPQPDIRHWQKVPLDRVGMLTRLSLRDSSKTLALSSLLYGTVYDQIALTARERMSEQDFADSAVENARDFIDERIDEEVHSIVSWTGYQISLTGDGGIQDNDAADELDPEQRPVAAGISQSRPLQNVQKSSLLCPLCRGKCTVLSYKQSDAEKQALGGDSRQTQSSFRDDNRAPQLKQHWDLRRCQRELLFLFDSEKKDQVCSCCKAYHDRLVNGEYNFMRSEFNSHANLLSFALVGIALTNFSCWWYLVALFCVPFLLTCRRWLRLGSMNINGQVLAHCFYRTQHVLFAVMQSAVEPGQVNRAGSNEKMHSSVYKSFEAAATVEAGQDSATSVPEMPFCILTDLQPQNIVGKAIHFGIQLLYATDTFDIGNRCAKSWFATCLSGVYAESANLFFAAVGIWRATRCQTLFRKLNAFFYRQLQQTNAVCRFRLNVPNVTLMNRLVRLVKTVPTDKKTHNEMEQGASVGTEAAADDAKWQFETTAEKEKFFAVFGKENAVLVEQLSCSDDTKVQCESRLAEEQFSFQQEEEMTDNAVIVYLRQVRACLCALWSGIVVDFTYAATSFWQRQPMEKRLPLGLAIGSLSAGKNLSALQSNPFLWKSAFCLFAASLIDTCFYGNSVLSPQCVANAFILMVRLEAALLAVKITIISQSDSIWYCSDITNFLYANTISKHTAHQAICAAVVKSSDGFALASGSNARQGDEPQIAVTALSCH